MAIINSTLAQNILDAFISSSPNPTEVSPNDNLINLCNGLANAIIAYDPNSGGAVSSVNGYTGVVVLNKSDIGLGNVDNTSDLNKPISIATQSALNNKANLTHTHNLNDILQSGASPGQVPQWNGTSWAPTNINNVSSVNGYTGVVVLNKSDIGLGNVDNIQQLPLSYLDIDIFLTANSDIKVPSQKAIKTYVDTGLSGKQNTLGFTPENIANKSTSLTSPNNTTYPTTQAVANDVLYTWDSFTSYTQGQKFMWKSTHGDYRTYIVRNGQTLTAGQTPLTNPEKVDKINPFDNYKWKFVTGATGGGVASSGISSIQNFLYDNINDKYVIAGGTTSDNIIICQTTISLPSVYASINIVNIGHDVQKVIYDNLNNEYWAINTTTANTLQITRVDATTNTVISTFTSTYTGTLWGGGYFYIRNNNVYYATAQSGTFQFRLHQIDFLTKTTTVVINITTTVAFASMFWWFDEINGFITFTTSTANTYRVFDINTFALLGTYNFVASGNAIFRLEPIYASDGNTYILIPQSAVYGYRKWLINPTTGAPTQLDGPAVTLSNLNAWQIIYDPSNPDWALTIYGSNTGGVIHLTNILTNEITLINTPYYWATVQMNTSTHYEYKDKQITMYYWVSAAGAGTIRQIIKMDFR